MVDFKKNGIDHIAGTLFLISAAIGVGLSYSFIYLAHAVLLVWILTVLSRIRKGKLICRIPAIRVNLHFFMLIMLFWYSLSMLWNPAPLQTAKYLLIIIYGLTIVFSVVYTVYDSGSYQRILLLLGTIYGIEAFIGLLESFTQFRWPISPISPLASLFGREMMLDAVKHSEAVRTIVQGYPTGFSWNPNNLSMTMLLLLPFTLLSRIKWLKILSPIVIGVLLYKANSRIGLLTFGIILILFLLFFTKRHWLYLASAVLLILILIPIHGSLSGISQKIPNRMIQTLFNPQEYLLRLFSSQKYKMDSIELRKRYALNSFAAFKKSGGLGVGGGCIGNERYQPGVMESGEHQISIHNFWLELLSEGGILFFGFFFLWYAALIVQLIKVRVRTANLNIKRMASACLLSLIGLLPAALCPSSAIYLGSMWILFGLSIAIINIYYNQKQEIPVKI